MSANNTNRINTEYNIIRIIHNILIFSVYYLSLGPVVARAVGAHGERMKRSRAYLNPKARLPYVTETNTGL